MVAKGYSMNHTIDWGTPLDFFATLNEEFNFTLDPCSPLTNPLKLPRFFTKEADGLKQQWEGNVFVNSPYGAKNLELWIAKAFAEWMAGRCPVIVMLLPIRGLETDRWHRYVCSCQNLPQKTGLTCKGTRAGIEVRFIKKRLPFVDLNSPDKKSGAGSFGSMLVIFRRNPNAEPAQ
jgi:site-specific DNA-methyltransferase (adenine-specific)